MQRSRLHSEEIFTDGVVELENVTILSIKNYGTSSLVVTHNSVPETLPPYDAVNDYASEWQLPSDCHPSEPGELKLTFPSKTGHAIMRYRILKQCPQ